MKRALTHALPAVGIAAVVGLFFLRGPMSGDERAALIEAHKPRLYDAYCELAALYDFDAVRWPSQWPAIPSLPEDAAEVIGQLSPDGDAQTALETIAGYERLFALLERVKEDDKVWWESFQSVRGSPSEAWTDEDVAEIRRLGRARPELIEAICAMAARGGPIYPLDLAVMSSGETLQHMMDIRCCADFLCADAVLEGAKGNAREAARDLVSALDLANALKQEPVSFSQWFYRYIVSRSVLTVQCVFERGEIPPDAGREILAGLEESGGREACKQALAGEFVLGLNDFGELASGRLPRRVDDTWGGVDHWIRFLRPLYKSPFSAPWHGRDERSYVLLCERLQHAMELPFAEGRSWSQETRDGFRVFPMARPLALFLVASQMDEPARHASTDSLLSLARIGIALEIHYQERGGYPDKLDAVGSYLGGSVPVDVLTGEPFHYTPQGDTFLLYSIGENLTDEGGVHDRSKGDVVWRPDAERSVEAVGVAATGV